MMIALRKTFSYNRTTASIISSAKTTTTTTRCRRCSKARFSSSSFSASTQTSSSTSLSDLSDQRSSDLSSRLRRTQRHQNQSTPAYSSDDERFVLVSKLPLTATPHDIRSLASHSQRESRDITHIRLLYTKYLHAAGKAIVTFNTASHAKSFSAQSATKMIGGHKVSMELISHSKVRSLLKPAFESSSIRLAKALIPSHSGRLVRLRGLPSTVTLERMYAMLERYGLADEGKRWKEPGNLEIGLPISERDATMSSRGGGFDKVQVEQLPAIIQLQPFHNLSMSTSFLVRLSKPFSAFRLASRWNSTYWDEDRTLARFRGRKSNENHGIEATITGVQSLRERGSGKHRREEDDYLEQGFEGSDPRSRAERNDKDQIGLGDKNVMEELQTELGGGMSQDGGGRLHVINANVLY